MEGLCECGDESPGRAWNDADIIEFLSFKHKTTLEGDLNCKHPFLE
jgi:hypothetical protein